MDETRKCNKCGAVKPIIEFYYDSRGHRMLHCRTCHTAYTRTYHLGRAQKFKETGPTIETKVCKTCGQEKAASEFCFAPSCHGGISTECKECDNRAGAEYRRSKQRRNSRYKRNYNISADEYDRLLAIQNNVCAICGKPETRRKPSGGIAPLHVDHDHRTGKVRALLCHNCNVGLGSFKDDPTFLANAIDYLEQHGDGETIRQLKEHLTVYA